MPKANHGVKLGLVSGALPVWMVQILFAGFVITPCGLQMPVFVLTNPHLRPHRRDAQTSKTVTQRLILNRLAITIAIAKAATPAAAGVAWLLIADVAQIGTARQIFIIVTEVGAGVAGLLVVFGAHKRL